MPGSGSEGHHNLQLTRTDVEPHEVLVDIDKSKPRDISIQSTDTYRVMPDGAFTVRVYRTTL